MKIRVLHAYYGCDTGCCGHILEIDGEEEYSTFTFDHFDEKPQPRTILDKIVEAVDGKCVMTVPDDLKAYILEKVPKECHDSIDWDSVELDDRWSCGL